MLRNGPLPPFLALVGAVAVLVGAVFGGGREAGGALSVGTIGAMVLGLLALLYGALGLTSVVLEGPELRPGRRPASQSRGALAVGLGLAAAAAAFAGALVRQLRHDLATGTAHPAAEGLLAAGLFLSLAALLAVYQGAFADDETTTDGYDTEVPW